MIYIQIAIAFGAMFILDFVFACYTKNVVKNKPAVAGLYAAAIVISNAAVTLNYVDNNWMIIPTVLGAFAGTWAAVRWE